MVFREIAYYQILGIHLLIYLGLITFILLILSIIFGYLVLTGKAKFNLHKVFGILTLISAVIHGSLAFLATFVG